MDKSNIILGPDGRPAPKPEYTGMRIDHNFVMRHAGLRIPAYKKMMRKAREPKTVTDVVKVGRNDPCPCESGKKFKYCHWAYVERNMT